jgi:hypothetical protein
MTSTSENSSPSPRGGRPKKQKDERRIASTRTDLTLAEKQFIREQSHLAGLSEAAFVRKRVLGHPVVVPKSYADARFLYELNSIGVNLNQIARNMNSDREGIGAVNLSDLQKLLRAVLNRALDILDD